MYMLNVAESDTFQKGVDEGRRAVLADLAKLVKDNEYPEYLEKAVYEYLTQEGYL